jgi:hypothetical protein
MVLYASLNEMSAALAQGHENPTSIFLYCIPSAKSFTLLDTLNFSTVFAGILLCSPVFWIGADASGNIGSLIFVDVLNFDFNATEPLSQAVVDCGENDEEKEAENTEKYRPKNVNHPDDVELFAAENKHRDSDKRVNEASKHRERSLFCWIGEQRCGSVASSYPTMHPTRI